MLELSILLIASASSTHASGPTTTEPRLKDGTVKGKIVRGIPTSNFPAVGLIMAGGQQLCTGTLISPIHFLTAQHCERGNYPAETFTVFFQHAGFYKVLDRKKVFLPLASYVRPTSCGSAADLLIVELDRPVTGIKPMPVNTTIGNLRGRSGRIIGYGFNGPTVSLEVSSGDNGIKREGYVDLGSCDFGSGCPSPSNDLVCWVIPEGDPLQNTCNGDSGGPLLVTVQSKWAIAGVTSGGTDKPCASTGNRDVSYDTQTYTHRDWIAGILKQANVVSENIEPLPETVSELGSGRQSWAFGHFNAPSDRPATYEFQINSAKRLRVGLNHASNSPTGKVHKAELELSLKGPAGQTASCEVRQFASFCEITNPAAGEWQAELTARAGEGDFQLTVSVF